MASSGKLRRVDLIRTDVSEELSASEMSVLARVTRRNILILVVVSSTDWCIIQALEDKSGGIFG
jgi:hypothetical protein